MRLIGSHLGDRPWGICTECGMARAERVEIPTLLDVHREIIATYAWGKATRKGRRPDGCRARHARRLGPAGGGEGTPSPIQSTSGASATNPGGASDGWRRPSSR